MLAYIYVYVSNNQTFPYLFDIWAYFVSKTPKICLEVWILCMLVFDNIKGWKWNCSFLLNSHKASLSDCLWRFFYPGHCSPKGAFPKGNRTKKPSYLLAIFGIAIIKPWGKAQPNPKSFLSSIGQLDLWPLHTLHNIFSFAYFNPIALAPVYAYISFIGGWNIKASTSGDKKCNEFWSH